MQKQIENMNIKNNDPWQSRVVERISLSENDNYSPRRNNDVYRYFSKSSISLFNYNDKYFNDINFDKCNQDERQAANCTRCCKKVEILCEECQHNKQYKPLHEALNIDFSASRPLKMLTYRDNYAPYTFDNSTRLQKNTQNDLEKYNYSKIYKETKKMKDPYKNIKNEDIGVDEVSKTCLILFFNKLKTYYAILQKNTINVEQLLGDNHQQYTVITGYAKSLLAKK